MYSARDGPRTTGAGFTHSGIHGSQAVQRLTVAYRSRPRPSSTPGAKASTVCPSYLDGDQALARAPGDTRLLAWLCSFQGPRRGARPDWALGLSKLNSMGPRETSSSAPRSG